MNYYPFHMGDYAVATRHLSLMEDLAYRRLLDLYYVREAPIPAETKSVSRLLGMREHEQEVASVLSEFFTQNEAGEWVHARCEAEIASAREARERARANGKRGGRPKKQADTKSKTQTKPTHNPEITDSVHLANPEITKSKAPNPKTNTKEDIGAVAPVSITDLVSDGLTEKTALEFVAHRKRKKAPLTPIAWGGLKAEALKAGWPLEKAVQKTIQRNWQSFEAAWVAPDKPESGLPSYT